MTRRATSASHVSGRDSAPFIAALLAARAERMSARWDPRREPRMRVLIVEDERRLADAVARGLRHRAMAVDIAYEGESALR